MFNWVVRNSLHNRLFVLVFAAILLVYGAITAWRTPVDTSTGVRPAACHRPHRGRRHGP